MRNIIQWEGVEFKSSSLQSLNIFGPRKGVEFEFQTMQGIWILEKILTGPAHQLVAQIPF
jgi:hypothetical protein